jgi:hypothetical protein
MPDLIAIFKNVFFIANAPKISTKETVFEDMDWIYPAPDRVWGGGRSCEHGPLP